jgi:uncharacterized protein (DUF697 family)/GTP-binding protein EngB required for normal cell division
MATKVRRGAAADENDPALDKLFDTDAFEVAAEEERAAIGRFNLLIAGNTGVGKSSLVNAVFGEKLARTGVGLPVTEGVHYYTNPGESLGIWDCEGFETGGPSPADRIRDYLDMIGSDAPDRQAQVAWYCVLGDSHRLTTADVRAITELSDAGLQVMLVLTKVPRAKRVSGKYEFSEQTTTFVESLKVDFDLPVKHIVLTAAEDQGKFGGPRHGLDTLLTLTLDLAPQASKDALRVAQRLSLPLKRELARRVIAAAATAAGAAAAAPIPLADAVTLAPIQLSMMGRLAAIYGLDLKVMLSAQAITQLGVQFAGRALARSFLKLVPGIGSVVNASVAVALTTATGEGWRRLCEAIFEGKVPIEKVETVFREYMPTAMQVMNALAKSKRQA